ncbi:MAG: C-GCAxxG-C-C family (seleno)protein [Ramlibacter sp.]
MKITRRNIVEQTGAVFFGAGLAGVSRPFAQAATGTTSNGMSELPWPYVPVDANIAAQAAYDGFYKGACMYGTFEGIIGQLRQKVGAPYASMPTSMMVYGEGGVAGISSLCGTLNGAAAAIFLIAGGMQREQREAAYAVTRELFNWYEQTALPDFRPLKPKFEITQSTSRSPLCHASVSNWCAASKFKSFSPQRAERCAWLAGSVARFAVTLLNDHAAGQFKAKHVLSEATATCRGCHDQGSRLENTRGMMDCGGGCHFTPPATHPKKRISSM